jgi:folylpolyglutamate synthase/dihydropteroate synthase
LSDHFPERHPVMVLGMLRDKAWREMATHLAPAASRLVIAPVSSPRTVQPDELRQALQEAHCGRAVRACASVDEALRAVAREPFVAVTGSLYFIGEVLERLGLATPNDPNDPDTLAGPTDSDGTGETSGTHATGGLGTHQRQLNEWAPPAPR